MELRHVPFCFLVVGTLALVSAFLVLPNPSPQLAAQSEKAELRSELALAH